MHAQPLLDGDVPAELFEMDQPLMDT